MVLPQRQPTKAVASYSLLGGRRLRCSAFSSLAASRKPSPTMLERCLQSPTTTARPMVQGQSWLPASTIPPARNASSLPSSELMKTPFYDMHVAAGAKMGEFAGFSMSLDYPEQSHSQSHHWTRNSASLFDVSHMVQHRLQGSLAQEFLMTVTPSSLDRLRPYSSQLSVLLNDGGGIVDDTVITALGPEDFYFVTNAGCRNTDLAFLSQSMSAFLESKRASHDHLRWEIWNHHALLALQGPHAQKALQPLISTNSTDADLSTLYFGNCRWLRLTMDPSLPCLVSRTGYTGEDGFEISIPPGDGADTRLARSLAEQLLGDGATVRWAGLATRDSLRLEAGMCLYGHDIDATVTPPMGGLGWVVGKDRRAPDATPAFNGRQRIVEQLQTPSTMSRRRVGLLLGPGPPAREGAEIVDLDKDYQGVGRVTSGCPSPTLGGRNIAMGWIGKGYHKTGTKIGVKVRSKIIPGEVVKMPFVKNKFYRGP
ncbi:Aminomethyltransferase, mitochondrial [Exophiala xenobiotica]|nr:Aminomethyltransferase, mitochondrial [Exophiala xenobiotica]